MLPLYFYPLPASIYAGRGIFCVWKYSNKLAGNCNFTHACVNIAHMKPEIAVIGAGAIGGTTAAFMAEAGYSVEIVTKYPELARKIESEGILITGVRGKQRVKMKAVPHVRDLKGPKDFVFIATKANDLENVARELLPFLHKDSRVVSMQNGICEFTLAEIVEKDRTVGCVVGWGATMVSPAHLEMTSKGHFWIGYINREPDDRLYTIKKLLETVVPVEISTDIIAQLYSKLIINSSITSLGALTGLCLGDMLKKGKIRRLFIKIMDEALEVADAMNLKVPPYEGKLDYYKLVNSKGIFGNILRYIVIRGVGFKYRKLKSSSLQSLERGRPTEIDYLNGFIVRKGKELGIPTPLNEKIVEMIKEIEQGKRPIRPENIEELLPYV